MPRVLSEAEYNAIRDRVLKAAPDGLDEAGFSRYIGPALTQAIQEAEGTHSTNGTIGPVAPQPMTRAAEAFGTPDPKQSVTLGELMADPIPAITKAAAIIGRDAVDPKTWLPVIAGYFGGKVAGALAPDMARVTAQATPGAPASPSVMAAAIKAAAPKVGRAMLGYRLGKIAEGVSEGIGAARAARAGAEPPATVPAEPPAAAPSIWKDGQSVDQAIAEVKSVPAQRAPVPSGPPNVALPAPPPAPPVEMNAPAVAEPPPSNVVQMPKAMSPQRLLNDVAIAQRRAGVKLTAAEESQALALMRDGTSASDAVAAVKPPPAPTTPKPKLLASEVNEYVKLIRSGKSVQQAYEAIQAQRELATRLGLTTPTPAQTQFPKGWGPSR